MAANVFVGLPDRPSSPTLTVSPNPTTGLVRIESEKPLRRVTLTDLQGRVLMEELTEDSVVTVNTTSYSTGVYLIKAINCDGEEQVEKVVKK